MPPQNDQNKTAADQKKAAPEKAAADKAGKRETFGEVKVISESKTQRVLQDDRFVWKEAK